MLKRAVNLARAANPRSIKAPYTHARQSTRTLPVMNLSCFHCKKTVELDSTQGARVGFRETCPHCSSDLHVCLNCEFHDEGAHHECRETSAEWVKRKDSSNVCEYFRPRPATIATGAEKKSALSALDSLFKK